ncbi:MAG: carbamoyl-phosphate synthase large subunit [Planctomycetota bacterium]
MPKRTDIEKILIIGSGPIVIGQACEFDYSGTQACKALRDEGFRVVLVNSNPATIMTDPEVAERTYIEPITAECVAKIIEHERPDALLPTLGGQTGLNTAIQLHESGVLEKFGVEMIGANHEAIKRAEDRELFKQTIEQLGLKVPASGIAHTLDEALALRESVGLPAVIRPAFTLGGAGGGIAYNVDELERIAKRGLELSMVSEVLIERSIVGWKEFELEVMRDKRDNVVIICSIENLDPMGIHTGDSITVAPAQTLTDREYQVMRDAAIDIIRAIGVETGGSNIQFAVEPETGEMVVIEMNPRVSRSSALASKATGFPIAKIAAKLAIGYTLDEIPNDITKKTPACFEPAIDYVVVKTPRWAFEKFPAADPTLTTQMKSVGEVMSIGRTFKEALQKALRSLEIGRLGLGLDAKDELYGARKGPIDPDALLARLATPTAERIFLIRLALKIGVPIERIHELTAIDRWFLHNIKEIVDFEGRLESYADLPSAPPEVLRQAKRMGFSDQQLATLYRTEEPTVRARRQTLGIRPVYKLVDTCAAEFESKTPYMYSTYESETEITDSGRRKIAILGGGPNRIGQGIEFDYCCVHASFALRELGFETIMVNSNPETVSTDFDTSNQLFFEPLTREDVLNIVESQKIDGVIVQLGGQTPLNLCWKLETAGVPILGTTPRQIDRAEDRGKFNRLIDKLGLAQPANGTATSVDEAIAVAERIGYPVMVRPSYVLGGRAMEIVYDRRSLEGYMARAVEASPEHPILIDKFLDNAFEVDVDCIADGKTVVIGGIMEHVEEAGIHSGDSTCCLPPFTLSLGLIDEIRRATHALALELQVCGLMNVQYAIKNDRLYVLEVNPRASRTVPFVSKAIGVPLAKLAAKIMAGATLQQLDFTDEIWPAHFSVKAPVFPFARFPGVDILLGPEMKSTGEVMGIDPDLGCAFAKAYIGASLTLPQSGSVFISVKDSDKRTMIYIARLLRELGFTIVATDGTYRSLKASGLDVQRVKKIGMGRPDIIDMVKNRAVGLIINTPSPNPEARADEVRIRSEAVMQGIPSITTVAGAQAVVSAIESLKKRGLTVKALQDYLSESRGRPQSPL